MTLRPLQIDVKRDVLRRASLFAGLKPAELEGLVGLAVERRALREQLVVRRGDPGDSLMVLVQGRLRVARTSTDGREVTLGLIEPGGVIGEIALLDGKPRSADVTAMLDSVLLVLERRDFVPFLRREPELAFRLMALLCERLRSVSLALEDVALASLPARLARLLLRLSDDYGTPGEEGVLVRLKLSQTDLSALVAATRESVNKQLRHWREAGVIGDRAGHLVLHRPEALRALIE